MINPINGVPFGQESTAKQCRDRAEWEYDQASRMRVQKHPVGYEYIAQGHEDAARAYEKRAGELEYASPPKPPTAIRRVAKRRRT